MVIYMSMDEKNNVTTMRVYQNTLTRFRKHKKYPEQTDERLLIQILNKLDAQEAKAKEVKA